MTLWCRRPMKIDVRLYNNNNDNNNSEESLWQNSFDFAGKGIQCCIIDHELFIPDWWLTWLIMGKAKSGARNSTGKGQRGKGKEKDRSSSVETHSGEERKRVMINCTNNCTKQSATVHYLSWAYRQQPMYLDHQHRRTTTLIPTEWNQSSNPPPRFAIVENCGFLNCLYRFLFLSRRRSKKLITVPTGYTTSPCR